MASYELIGLNEATPDLRAPTASDTGVVSKIRATSGILFGADTAAANTLDDYEEGTFTPALAFGGASTGITYNGQEGWYTKIGNRVNGEIRVSLSSKGSATGAATVSVPFACNSSATYRAAPVLTPEDITITDFPRCNIVGSSSTTINLQECTNAGVATALTDADFINTSNFIVSFSYIV